MAVLAGDHLDAGDRVFLGLVGQHRAVDGVADRPDARGRGLEVVGFDEAALVRGDPDVLQAQALGVGTPADGDQHVLGFQGLGRAASHRLDGQRDALLGGGRAGDLGAQLKLHALLGQRALEGLGGLGVHARRDAVEELDDGHLRTQAAPHRAQLQADDAGADDDQALGDLRQRQGAGGVDDALLVDGHARQRGRLGAGGDDDVLGFQGGDRAVLGGDLDLARAGDLARALDPLDLVLLEQELDALGQGGHRVGLLLHHLHEVQLGLHLDAEGGEFAAGGFVEFRGVQQRLGGHTADIEAGAAERRALLHHGDLQAQLARADAGVVAAGAAADDDDVVLSHCSSVLSKTARREAPPP